MDEEVQFAYALNEHRDIVHVSEAVRGGRYHCCGCDQRMIAALGSVNKHHFRHENLVCGSETYLHQLGKYRFAELFRKSVSGERPMRIELNREIVCKSPKAVLADAFSGYCKGTQLAAYNLCDLFDQVSVESFDGDTGLRPDVLLTSTEDPSRKCYVEICVTHACTEEKIASGVPIIEFRIGEEADIENLLSACYSRSDNRINFYNFSPPTKEVEFCHEGCPHSSELVIIWDVTPLGRLQRSSKPFEALEVDVLPHCLPLSYECSEERSLLRKLLREKDPESRIPNCLTCISSRGWYEGEVECKALNRRVPYDEARSCSQFRLDK